jgi:putative methionine-R-sulfoxide reductase with GAF domain
MLRRETSGINQLLDEVTDLADALLVKDAELQPTLDAILSAAARAVPGSAYAGLMVLEQGRLVPKATTGEPPRRLDIVQRELGDGPCVAAAAGQVLVSVPDMDCEVRWPQFAAAACRLNVQSMLCMPLAVGGQRMGALSLYGAQRRAFGEASERLARLCALLCSRALGDALRSDQLRRALAGRDLIGQAKGILMERHRLTADQAFDRLSAASQSLNLRMAAVAEHLTATGELPR